MRHQRLALRQRWTHPGTVAEQEQEGQPRRHRREVELVGLLLLLLVRLGPLLLLLLVSWVCPATNHLPKTNHIPKTTLDSGPLAAYSPNPQAARNQATNVEAAPADLESAVWLARKGR